MTAIPEPERAARDSALLQQVQDANVVSLDNYAVSHVSENMTVSLRKPATTVSNSSSSSIDTTTFMDSRFVMPPCPQFPPKEYQPVETFVSNAISSSSMGKPYRAILDALRKKQDAPLLCKVLLALRGKTLTLLSSNPKQHDHLLHLLFRLDPFLKEAHPKLPSIYSLADAHLHLVLALVSANSVFTSQAMEALWRLLVVSGNGCEIQEARSTRLHATLCNMIRLVPKAALALFPVMAASFPFRTRPKSEIECYTQTCLYVLQYNPTLHSQVLELLLDKCLEMDVEIKISDRGQVSIDQSSSHYSLDNAEEEFFELELENNETTPTPMKQDSVQQEGEQQVDEMADKLDSLMTIVMEHICDYSTRHGASFMYRMISPVFDSSILTTHRSKFVQFVIFVVCGMQEHSANEAISLDREFAAKLIDVVLDPYRATVTRQSGACYLASFISRARYVSAETACEAVAALLKWAEAYMDSDYGKRASNLREQCDLHSLFYTVCQAAFYIMCFRGADAIKYYRSAMEYHDSRHDELRSSEEEFSYADPEHVDIGPERWTKLCGHDLKPLKFCLESVRGEFLHVAHVFGLLPPPLLQRLNADDSKMSTTHASKPRKPSLISTPVTLAKQRLKGGVGGIGRGSNPLDSFFPYDPYLLCQSHSFVEPFYKNWEGSIEQDDALSDDEGGEAGSISSADETSNASDSDDDDEEQQATHMPQSVDSIGGQPMSFVSNASIESNSTQPETPDAIMQKKQLQKEAWSESLKRARAPSIENGSW